MGERRTIFDVIADSLIKRSHKHFAGNDGNLVMEARPHRDVEKYVEHQPMC